MAVLGMHQYGLYLSDLSGVAVTDKIEETWGPRIILPLEIIERSDLPASWNVTSDTIAGYIAKTTGLSSFIKLTDVEGIIIDGKIAESIAAGKLLNTTTCLDKSLPAYLQTWKMDCRVLSGRTENNIRRALEGDPVGTLVTGGK
ncbi:MAG TPA: amino acid kinase [Euryarchaeota archaeon]|nr:amino acid kinase [Euryarchaeota archaeon]